MGFSSASGHSPQQRKPVSPYQLGATLYMPATRTDIDQVILNQKVPGLTSLVICLEDAVSHNEVDAAVDNLTRTLSRLNTHSEVSSDAPSAHRPLVFIRPRHQAMAQWLIQHLDLSEIDGFVLPKFTRKDLVPWAALLESTHLYWMPTLETADVFDLLNMQQLATALDAHPLRERILALRIGGNDLMNLLSLRRHRTLTLYDTPMGFVIQMLTCLFASRGFALTAPVCEIIDDEPLLSRELEKDIAHGLVGKTAIHPSQVSTINRALAVHQNDYKDASDILEATHAVFKSNGAMCEPATQHHWANHILVRAMHYGMLPTDESSPPTEPSLPDHEPATALITNTAL